MTKQKPTMWFSQIDRVEADCACSDTGAPVLMMHRNRQIAGGEYEQDCACSQVGQSAQKLTPLHASLWQRPPDLYRADLPEQHVLAFAPTLSTGIVVLNEPACSILDSFAAPRRPSQAVEMLPGLDPVDVERTVFQLAQQGLLRPADEQQEVRCPVPSHTLTVWFQVTNQCNLRCSYCYVHKNGEAMDETTGKATVEAVFRSAKRHGFQAIKLKYAGGEPTLNFSLVRSLHTYAKLLAESYGLELREVLLSNGVGLPDTTIVAVRDMGIRLALSLDGIGITHDVQRGEGTFVQVMQTVERAIALGLRPHLSITVTAQSVDGLPDTVAFVLDHDLPFNLNFYREHDYEAQKTSLRADNERLIGGMQAAFALIEKRLPQRSIVGGLVDRANLSFPHSRPCSAGQSYIVVDHRGRISRCQMEMENVIGTVWEDDPLAIIRSAQNGFRNLEVDARDGCDACTWRYWCAGGCPLLTYRLTGSHGRSPYCEVYRALFPKVLYLEGLRQLKWGLLAT